MIETSGIGLVRLPSVTMSAPVVSNYKITLARLGALRHEEDEDARPSAWAFDTTFQLFDEAGTAFPKDLPVEYVSSDGEGGLRVEWKCSTRQIRLVVSALPAGRSYIYHQEGDTYGIVDDLTPASLAGWLTWLTQDGR